MPVSDAGSNKEMRMMLKIAYRRLVTVALAAILFSCGPALFREAVAASPLQAATVGFAQSAVQRALNYEQGNRASLIDAQNDFTADGWRAFMKWLHGYVDATGAPNGSSRFTPAGKAALTGEAQGLTRLAIRGTLKQQVRNARGGVSATTYRVVIRVQVGGNPLKIHNLETVTCGRHSTNASCR